MRLIIELSDETYDKVINPDNWYNPNSAIKDIVNAIINGTPLPKGHGRLIDADRLLKEHGDDITNWEEPFGVQNNNISTAPTIIEAGM